MTPDQKATADVYASIPMQTRISMLNDLSEYAHTLSEPLVAAGVMLAATRIIRQATRTEREKRRKQ